MGRELEYKLAVPDAALLDKILHEPKFSGMQCTEIKMVTTYFDTPDAILSSRHWMLRRRQENESSVICFKMPLGGRLRGEWEVNGCALAPALRALSQLEDVPAELGELNPQELQPICGADFLRRALPVTFCDGSTAELAFDCGKLTAGARSLPLSELELELKSGDDTQMRALAAYLRQTYGLCEEPLSKFARARQLAAHC